MQLSGTLGFGIVRAHNGGLGTAQAQARFNELCELLARGTGIRIFAHHASTYRELADQIARGTLGIAWMPPILAIDLRHGTKANGTQSLVIPVRRGSTFYNAAFIVARGGAKTLPELKGKKIAWVEKESAAGYIVPRMHLASVGLDPKTLFGQEIFVGNHNAVVDAVVGQKVDVGATFCSFDIVSKRIVQAGWTSADGKNVRPVEVVATTGPIPNDLVVASSKVNTEQREAITRWFLSPDPRGKVLLGEVLRADSFRLASAAQTQLDALRQLMAFEARIES